jgi:calmodulin
MVSFYVEKDDSKLDRLFEIYDRNGNGSISAEELRTVMRAISPDGFDEDTITGMIEEADKNNNGQIELEEFRAVMISRRDS